jgi:hypothetical protein
MQTIKQVPTRAQPDSDHTLLKRANNIVTTNANGATAPRSKDNSIQLLDTLLTPISSLADFGKFTLVDKASEKE